MRSWLLDLLDRALDRTPSSPGYVATRRTRAKVAGRSMRRSGSPYPLNVITASLFARFASRQDDSPAMKAVAALRQPVRRPRGQCRTRSHGAEVYVRRLELTDFRSYPHAAVDFEPGPSVLVGPNGYGKTNLVEALGYVATLGSHRVSTDHPLVRVGAERGGHPLFGRARRAGAPRRTRDRAGQGEPRPPGTVASCPGPATCSERCGWCCSPRRTWRWYGATRPSGVGTSTTCSCNANRGTPACGPTMSVCSSSATPCCVPPIWPARWAVVVAGDLSTLDVWDTHLARHGAELLVGSARVVRGAGHARGEGVRRGERRPR